MPHHKKSRKGKNRPRKRGASRSAVLREITFPREYRQAGIGLMSYFGEVLLQKYPDVPAALQMTQEALTVRMKIKTTDDYSETVEKTLEEYGLLILGQQKLEAFFPHEIDAMRFQNQLRFTYVQLEQELRLTKLAKQPYASRIESLQHHHINLLELVGRQFSHADRLVNVLELSPSVRDTALGSQKLEDMERAHIQSVLAACNWRIKGPGQTAERLGLHPSTLWSRMKKLGIIRPQT